MPHRPCPVMRRSVVNSSLCRYSRPMPQMPQGQPPPRVGTAATRRISPTYSLPVAPRRTGWSHARRSAIIPFGPSIGTGRWQARSGRRSKKHRAIQGLSHDGVARWASSTYRRTVPPQPWAIASRPRGGVIEEEPIWRHKPVHVNPDTPAPRVIATRWRAFQDHALEVRAESADDSHVIGIALRRINVGLAFNGRVIHDGVFMPGMLIVNEPSVLAHGLLRGPTDVL